MRRALPLLVATMTLAATACAGGTIDTGAKDSACARVATLKTELATLQNEKMSTFNLPLTDRGMAMIDIQRRETTLRTELTTQEKVCNGG